MDTPQTKSAARADHIGWPTRLYETCRYRVGLSRHRETTHSFQRRGTNNGEWMG